MSAPNPKPTMAMVIFFTFQSYPILKIKVLSFKKIESLGRAKFVLALGIICCSIYIPLKPNPFDFQGVKRSITIGSFI